MLKDLLESHRLALQNEPKNVKNEPVDLVLLLKQSYEYQIINSWHMAPACSESPKIARSLQNQFGVAAFVIASSKNLGTLYTRESVYYKFYFICIH